MARAALDDPYAIVSKLAQLAPPSEKFPVRTASDLLQAFAAGCDSQGRYYANEYLMVRLLWWQEETPSRVAAWRDELVDRGDLDIRADGLDCYSDSVVDIAYLTHPRDFQRFTSRRKISSELRTAVYRRDKYRCVTCGTREGLSLDHIVPWSLNGSDDFENLQTMCRPCNSRKGAR